MPVQLLCSVLAKNKESFSIVESAKCSLSEKEEYSALLKKHNTFFVPGSTLQPLLDDHIVKVTKPKAFPAGSPSVGPSPQGPPVSFGPSQQQSAQELTSKAAKSVLPETPQGYFSVGVNIAGPFALSADGYMQIVGPAGQAKVIGCMHQMKEAFNQFIGMPHPPNRTIAANYYYYYSH